MKFIHALTFFIFLTFANTASAQEKEAFNPIKEMFAALSAFDYDGMAATVTDDMQLLEDGMDWDMDDLINAIKGAEGTLERRNYFNIIRSRGDERSMWFSYWNRAEMKPKEGEEFTIEWLESAVVINVDGTWKIEMIHSTHLGQNMAIPTDAVMTEYVGKNLVQN